MIQGRRKYAEKFACPRCGRWTKIDSSFTRKAGRVRYRSCAPCDHRFRTLQSPETAEQVEPARKYNPKPKTAVEPGGPQRWSCNGCRYRPHCDRVEPQGLALPCEQHTFAWEKRPVDSERYYLLPVLDAARPMVVHYE